MVRRILSDTFVSDVAVSMVTFCTLTTAQGDALTPTAARHHVLTLTAEHADDGEVNQPGPRPPPVVWV